jgi:hypothetical protein
MEVNEIEPLLHKDDAEKMELLKKTIEKNVELKYFTRD